MTSRGNKKVGLEKKKSVLVRRTYQVISRIDMEDFSKISKDPWRIVLEFEVIFHPRCEFIPSPLYKRNGG
jgi:hypothetical protein